VRTGLGQYAKACGARPGRLRASSVKGTVPAATRHVVHDEGLVADVITLGNFCLQYPVRAAKTGGGLGVRRLVRFRSSTWGMTSGSTQVSTGG
jgi:hypothetical protein